MTPPRRHVYVLRTLHLSSGVTTTAVVPCLKLVVGDALHRHDTRRIYHLDAQVGFVLFKNKIGNPTQRE